MGSIQSAGIAGLLRSTWVFHKGLVILLVLALGGTDTVVGFAKDSPAPDPSLVAAQVKQFGVGKSVKVKLIGGEKLTGHIQSIAADTFTVRLSKAAGEREIAYTQVAEIKDPSPLFWMLVGAAIVIVIIVAAKH